MSNYGEIRSHEVFFFFGGGGGGGGGVGNRFAISSRLGPDMHHSTTLSLATLTKHEIFR